MSGQFDFRDGMLLERVVYKDDSINCKSKLYYIGFLLLTYVWIAAWFALFFYLYVFHEKIQFWINIAIWLIHAIILVIFGARTIMRAKQEKLEKQRRIEEMKREEEILKQAKRRKLAKVAPQQPPQVLETEGIPEYDNPVVNTEEENLN